MVSATKCCLFISKVTIVVLALGAWVMAVAGLGKLNDVCKEVHSSRVCGSGLQSQWWTVILQAVVIGGVIFLSCTSRMRKWRIAILGLIAIVSVRLMSDIETGLSGNTHETRLKELDKELHTRVVTYWNNQYDPDSYHYGTYSYSWDGSPKREKNLQEAITMGHNYLATDIVASLKANERLEMGPFGLYVTGLIILTMVDFLLVMGIGTDETLSDYEQMINKWIDDTSSDEHKGVELGDRPASSGAESSPQALPVSGDM